MNPIRIATIRRAKRIIKQKGSLLPLLEMAYKKMDKGITINNDHCAIAEATNNIVKIPKNIVFPISLPIYNIIYGIKEISRDIYE